MSKKVADSIRIPVEFARKILEEMREINLQEEIRHMMEEFVENKNKKKLLAKAKEIRRNMKVEKSAGLLIREDRNARAIRSS